MRPARTSSRNRCMSAMISSVDDGIPTVMASLLRSVQHKQYGAGSCEYQKGLIRRHCVLPKGRNTGPSRQIEGAFRTSQGERLGAGRNLPRLTVDLRSRLLHRQNDDAAL